MPLRIICSRCSEILFEDPHPTFNCDVYKRPYIQVIIDKLRGRCPRCGNQLRLPPKTVEVFPVEEG